MNCGWYRRNNSNPVHISMFGYPLLYFQIVHLNVNICYMKKKKTIGYQYELGEKRVS